MKDHNKFLHVNILIDKIDFQMKKKIFSIITFLILISGVHSFGQLPAFPGAEGFGANTIGGRGGQVIKVTNLDDNGPGSFREAVEAPSRHRLNGNYKYEPWDEYISRLEASGHRIIVFEVSGIINLESNLTISYPFITIAGQTSPGGILITGYQTTVNTWEVIIRHMRFRVGSHRIADGADPEKMDSFDIYGQYWGTNEAYNIIIDHCSFSWGIDETVTITGGVLNTTVQWCIVSEGLRNAGHPEGERSMGLLLSGKYVNPSSISLHHNYVAHNYYRSPLISSPEGVDMLADVVNNITYNWKGGLSPYSRGTPKVNWIHNYMKQGASSNDYSFEVNHKNDLPPEPQLYVEGNIGSTRLSQDEPQWNVGYSWRNISLDTAYRTLTPWSAPQISTSEMSYNYALEILDNVGATKPIRDSVDARVIADFDAGTGDIIDNVVFPDDFPTFQDIDPPLDSDEDGMPNSWEIANSHDPVVADDKTVMPSGYTAIEEYLHYLAIDNNVITSSIAQEVLNNSIKLYPNPTHNVFTIDVGDDVLKKAIIYNNLGEQIGVEVSNRIDISRLPSGVYTIDIITQKGNIVTKKVIKN